MPKFLQLLPHSTLNCALCRLNIVSYLAPKQDHVEGYLELSAKTKAYFATAVAMWEAEYYVKVDDDVHVNIGN